MAHLRVLKEQMINRKEGAEDPCEKRKIAEVKGERRCTHNIKPTGDVEKENKKKRGRPRSRPLLEPEVKDMSRSDSDNSPPAKQAKKADNHISDGIKRSNGGHNRFVAFVRPGKRPAPLEPPMPVGRTRKLTKRAADRTGENCRPNCARTGGAVGITAQESDAVMLESSGSESDDEADSDEEAVATNAPTGEAWGRSCSTRAAARFTTAVAKKAGSARRQGASMSTDFSGSDSDDDEATSCDSLEESQDGASSSDGEEYDDETPRGNGRRYSVGLYSHVKSVPGKTDDDEEESGSEDSASSSEDSASSNDGSSSSTDGSSSSAADADNLVLPRRGRGRPPKDDGAKTGKAALQQKQSARDLGAKAKGKSREAAVTRGAAVKVHGVPKEEPGSKDKKTKGAGQGKESSDTVERILSYNPATNKYLVKLAGMSYRRTTYIEHSVLKEAKPILLRYWTKRNEQVDVDPAWLQVERVIASRAAPGDGQGSSRQLLVKWHGLEYTESTWEFEEDLTFEDDKAAIARFERFNVAPTGMKQMRNLQALRRPDFELPKFCNGRALRDYQEVSVRWMINNYCMRRNCILGDEMGLGKTAQSIACLEVLRTRGNLPGPFLIIAPLTTLGHWQREIQTWTDMNVVVYGGSAADRAMVVEYEFYHSKLIAGVNVIGKRRQTKFNVLLSSYETLRRDGSVLDAISWAAVVIDEAHRLKGLHSHVRSIVMGMDIDWLLLLTGTPIQNNMLELYSIVSLLDPNSYPSKEHFTGRFGGAPGGPPPSVEQIRALQGALAPVLLRRMKEDVEELPQKEEVVVWVELTAHQRAYYRAMYEGQIAALLAGVSAKNLPAMRNLAVELRKLCCHPVLCDGLEEDLKRKLALEWSQAPPDVPPEFTSPEVELLVRGSGKMVLLHKLLHKLKTEGRRVLIFSQFVMMLNVLEDYCDAVGFPVERIDGTTSGRDRQQAIDRFSAEGNGTNNAFVFLLSTRAGGQGITLTAADTCIIYDSDWNPQNDLQAMARCHRIGQKKEVTVYRLINRDTYEMALFNSASRKYGLDEAILGFSGGSDPEVDAARIADLLRHGAHGLLSDMEAGLRQGEAFASEDINQILAGRTEKRQIGSRAGNNFSVATFAAAERSRGIGAHRKSGGGKCRGDGGDDGDDEDEDEDAAYKDYWRKLLPDAVAAHEARGAESPVFLGRRMRKKVNYNVDAMSKGQGKSASDDISNNSRLDGEQVGGNGAHGEGGSRPAGTKPRSRPRKQIAGSGDAQVVVEATGEKASAARKTARSVSWKRTEAKELEDILVALGPDRWSDLNEQLQPCRFSAEDVEAAGRALWALYGIAAKLAEERKAETAKTKATSEATQHEAKNLKSEEVDDDPNAPKLSTACRPSLDEFEQRLEKAIREQFPECLHKALCSPPSLRSILREAAGNIRHGKRMQELYQLVMGPAKDQRRQQQQEPQQGQEGAAGTATTATTASGATGQDAVGEGANKINGYHVSYLAPPVVPGSYLKWWSRADDEALLMAAVKYGYSPRRTVRLAFQNQPLAGRVVQKPEPESNHIAEPQPADGPAAPVPCVPEPNAPVQLSAVEWRNMENVLSKRLSLLITQTIDLHHKLARITNRQLPVANSSRPKDMPPSIPNPAPASDTGAVAGDSSRHPRIAVEADARPQGTQSAMAVQATPANKGTVVNRAATVTASTKQVFSDAPPSGNRVPLVLVPASGGLTAQQQQQRQKQQQQQSPLLQERAVDLCRGASAEQTALCEPDRPARIPAATAAAAAAAPQVAGRANKAGALKQATLPFLRMESSGTLQPKSTPGIAGVGCSAADKLALLLASINPLAGSSVPTGNAHALVMAAAAAAALSNKKPAGEVPGSAKKPIEIADDSS